MLLGFRSFNGTSRPLPSGKSEIQEFMAARPSGGNSQRVTLNAIFRLPGFVVAGDRIDRRFKMEISQETHGLK
jgi:hypothetical protein